MNQFIQQVQRDSKTSETYQQNCIDSAERKENNQETSVETET